MKKNIHPPYHDITVVMTDGEKRVMRSCYGKPGDVLTLDIDNKVHPAWTGKSRALDRGGSVDAFKDRYGNLGL